MVPIAKTLTWPMARLGAAAQNALEVARFGGLATDVQPSPHSIVTEGRVHKLRRYYEQRTQPGAPPVLLVPPMMLAAEIYDVSPETSAVSILSEHGADPWVVDFGVPEREQGGLDRTLSDHVVAVSDAIDRVREETGRDVTIAGYSQGGMFCYQAAAYRRNAGLSSVVTFGSSVDTHVAMPFGVPGRLAVGAANLLADRVFREWALPAWFSRTTFSLIDPAQSLRSRIDFILRLHDREALLPREGQRRFIEADGWVAWPGPAMADFLTDFIAHNRLLEGGSVIDDTTISLADIVCPILSVVGTVDEIAPAAGVRAIRQAAPQAEIYELALRGGHFGLVVGSVANDVTWPTVAAWVASRAGDGELPGNITSVPEGPAEPVDRVPEISSRLGYGLSLAGGVGTGIARSALSTARRGVAGARELARDGVSQLPRLTRLESIQTSTRISLGLLFEERRRRRGGDIFFLFQDRAYTASDFNERIDNVVRGLISIGVRQGERVGVLMGARPSALAIVVALNRLGAVVVMLRPDGDVALEAGLGQVRRIIADPERAALAAQIGTVPAFILGGGRRPRDLEIPLAADMEQINPRSVALPGWYRPNPGRGSDVAFVLFTGEGSGTRMNTITNRLWAMSALGTASSAALSDSDTVYSMTPLYHASGLMMSIGGAIVGGARLAMATSFEPHNFWEEARRYGVTVASYTWTMLRELVAAEAHPGERHHSVRLFIGSGIPPALWRRVQDRFRPARVLEFYAATGAGVVLVNVSGAKLGSMGRPLPGSAEVRLAAYDATTGQYVLGRDGLVSACGPGEIGMLLASARQGEGSTGVPLRGVFAAGDTWLELGDLFRRDADGDYWRVDSIRDVVHTAAGPVFPGPIRDALGTLPAVDLAIAYGVPRPGSEQALALAAITLVPGAKLATRDLTASLRTLRLSERPQIVHVVAAIPVTTWWRPVTGPLREAGIPEAGSGSGAWYLDSASGGYKPLTVAARRRLAG